MAAILLEPAGAQATDDILRFGLAECDAIIAGVRATETALNRASISGMLRLFDDHGEKRHDDRNLDLIRAYAELRRAVFHLGRTIPAVSLEVAGYSPRQIARINTLIDTLAAGWAPHQGDGRFTGAVICRRLSDHVRATPLS